LVIEVRVEKQIKKVKNNIWKIFEFQLLPILVILEVAELCLDLLNLIREVKELHNEKEALHQIVSLRNLSRIQPLIHHRLSIIKSERIWNQ
jgi:hypothetical protein